MHDQGGSEMRHARWDLVSRPTEQLLQLVTAVLMTMVIVRNHGSARGLRYLAGLVAALSAQEIALTSAMRAVGARRLALSDLISLSRATCASILAGLVASGIKEREGVSGWIGWSAAAWGMASDLLDGKVARGLGETKLSSVLDIECDSWFTLWLAAAAASWGQLPRWCLLPPIFRYVHPVLDLLRGELPVGGGPWWGRLTGGSQTVLLLSALRPPPNRFRDRFLKLAWLPISAGQFLAMVMLFSYNRKIRAKTERENESTKGGSG
jgi:phosphatidylglycerophosphate synthase